MASLTTMSACTSSEPLERIGLLGNGPSPNRPNILFIEVDDLSYKYLGCFGSDLVKTPSIDSLAQRGVLFSNAVCQGMMCGPSRNCLMTGLYPHNLGFYRNGQMKQLPEGVWTLPKALQRSDYYTAWVGKCHVRPYGMRDNPDAMKTEMGFDFVRQTVGRAVLGSKEERNDWYSDYLRGKGLYEQFRREFPVPSTLAEDDYLDGFFTKTAIGFLNNYQERQPLFLWLNYSLPHGPHDVNRTYLDQFSPETMPGPNKADFEPPEKLVKDTRKIESDEKIKERQAAYCGGISFLDRQVGRILDTLRDRELLENTVVVFFSDQGVMMGDHGRVRKGTLFRQITNPCLVISWPKQFEQDTIVDSPVELTDLLRTSLDLAQASDQEKGLTSGYSLLPLLTGQGDFGREMAFGEIEGYVAASNGRYRLITGEDVSLLFDEIDDPDNLHNISEEKPELVKTMKKHVEEWLETTGPALPKNSF